VSTGGSGDNNRGSRRAHGGRLGRLKEGGIWPAGQAVVTRVQDGAVRDVVGWFGRRI
jgi:hypothetical protein